MPQVFQVLKCYKCSIFQIHQTKKSNKFECKMCGEKQSIKRHYGIGTGKDCRMHVQKLNVLRGNMDTKTSTETDSDNEYEDDDDNTDEKITHNIENPEAKPVKRSRWSSFIDEETEKESIEESMFLGDREVFLELPQKKKAKKFIVKTKSSNTEEHINNTKDNCKSQLKFNLKVSYKDNIHKIEEIPVHDVLISNDTRTDCQLSTYNVENEITKKSLEKPVVLQTINKNSRWAQYTDEDTDVDSVVLPNNDSKECVSNSDNLFSLCDDNDLDQLLDI